MCVAVVRERLRGRLGLFYALTTAALFVQRRREARGELPAPEYRTPLYPLPALVFIVATAGIIASDLHDSGWKAWAGVGVAALGFPVFWIWKGAARKRA